MLMKMMIMRRCWYFLKQDNNFAYGGNDEGDDESCRDLADSEYLVELDDP